MNLEQVTDVAGLPEAETELLGRLVRVWSEKLAKNREKVRYYEMKNRLKDLGIAIPTPLLGIDLVVGWPAKAVDCLAVRSHFDGFTFSDGDDRGVKSVLDDNHFGMLYRQAVTDELINSCSFITVTRGEGGEPEVMLSAYSAMDAAAIWNRRAKRVEAGVVVVDTERSDETGEDEPTWVNLFTGADVWEIRRSDSGRWESRRNRHKMGRPLIEPLAYKANTTYRPFGRSRISRAVMRITDAALRANLREEVSAEFAAIVQKYFLGVDESFFEDNDKLDAFIGSVLAITSNEEGEKPTVGQFPQTQTQPQIEHMRMLAARFSGETCIPVSELGIMHDNPISYEALITMYSSLITECEDLNYANGESLKEVGKMVVAMLGGKSYGELDDAERSIMCNWRDPSMVNSVAKTDALVKKASIFPWLPETETALEEAGYGEDRRVRLLSDKRAIESRAMIRAQREQAAQAAAGGGIDDTANFYRIMSIVKDYNRGAINEAVALRMLQTLDLAPEEASQIISAQDGDPSDIEIPEEMAGEDGR